MSDWWDDFFGSPRPPAARGGIKSQSGGDFGKHWWARRWLEVLEGFQIGARLHRGRAYATQGQVLSIDIKKGVVTARVQGNREHAYRVKIEVEKLSKKDKRKLARRLSRKAIYAAKLLSGDMPFELEDEFKAAGLNLFPSRLDDLQTSCSCPDWSNPCKHTAAVFFLLAEEFDRNPLVLLTLRGIDRAELVEVVGSTGRKRSAAAYSTPVVTTSQRAELLPANPDTFWAGRELPDDFFGEVRAPSVPAALPKRLGSFPLWQGQKDFLGSLEEIYRRASRTGMKVFVGDYRAK